MVYIDTRFEHNAIPTREYSNGACCNGLTSTYIHAETRIFIKYVNKYNIYLSVLLYTLREMCHRIRLSEYGFI